MKKNSLKTLSIIILLFAICGMSVSCTKATETTTTKTTTTTKADELETPSSKLKNPFLLIKQSKPTIITDSNNPHWFGFSEENDGQNVIWAKIKKNDGSFYSQNEFSALLDTEDDPEDYEIIYMFGVFSDSFGTFSMGKSKSDPMTLEFLPNGEWKENGFYHGNYTFQGSFSSLECHITNVIYDSTGEPYSGSERTKFTSDGVIVIDMTRDYDNNTWTGTLDGVPFNEPIN